MLIPSAHHSDLIFLDITIWSPLRCIFMQCWRWHHIWQSRGSNEDLLYGVNYRETWHAAVHWITKCWTQLNDWTTTVFRKWGSLYILKTKRISEKLFLRQEKGQDESRIFSKTRTFENEDFYSHIKREKINLNVKPEWTFQLPVTGLFESLLVSLWHWIKTH